jgi:hypothetical protein
MVAEYGLTNELYLLYFAELTNTHIHPNIENVLNYHYVKGIFDLELIINSGHFAINTRIVKYLLNADPGEFITFMQRQTDDFSYQLYHMALGNGYHTIEAYQSNLHYLSHQLLPAKTLNITLDNGY